MTKPFLVRREPTILLVFDIARHSEVACSMRPPFMRYACSNQDNPRAFLDVSNATFYTQGGLAKLANHLKPDGVFGLWSNDLPDKTFTEILKTSFARATPTTVTFHNPLQNADFTQTIYRACK